MIRKNKFSIFSLIPKPTYNSDNGIGLHGSTEYPIGKAEEKLILITAGILKPVLNHRLGIVITYLGDCFYWVTVKESNEYTMIKLYGLKNR